MVQRNRQVFAFKKNIQNLKFNILYWNAGGLNENKIIMFKQILRKNPNDIFAIIDAGKMAEDDEKLSKYFKSYQLKQLKRGRSHSSGMIIGVKVELVCRFKVVKEMNQIDHLEAVSLSVWKDKQEFNSIILYNPPNNKANFEAIPLNQDCVWIGDFNSPSPRWGYKQSTSSGKNLEDFLDSSNDHKVLSIVLVKDSVEMKERKTFTSWNLKKSNWNLYRDLTDANLNGLFFSENINFAEEILREKLLKCAKQSIPRGKIFDYNPFWSPILSELTTLRDEALHDLENCFSVERSIELKKRQANLLREINSSKNFKFLEKLESLNFVNNASHSHKLISQMNETHSEKSNEALIVNDNILTSNAKKAKAFAKYFAKVSSKKSKFPKISRNQKVISFSLRELTNAVDSLEHGKAPGPCGIMPEFIKYLGMNSLLVLLAFFNLVLAKGIPDIWRKAWIIPILKPGKSPSDLASYRPIALTSVLCKLYEKMLMNRLNFHIESERKINPEQGAFRCFRSALDQVSFIVQRIQDGF